MDFVRVNEGIIKPSGTMREVIFADRGPHSGTHLVKRPGCPDTVITSAELRRKLRFIEFRIVGACVANMIHELAKVRTFKRRLRTAPRTESLR